MDPLWDRLEKYLKTNAPRMLAGLAPPVFDVEIREVEDAVGHYLPHDVRYSLIRHNRQLLDDGLPVGGALIPRGFRLLSLDGIRREWEEHRAIVHRLGVDVPRPSVPCSDIKPYYLLPGWIPVAADVDGNSICVDMDPNGGGTIGQVIEFRREGTTPKLVAVGYGEWLQRVVDDLEDGRYVYVDQGNEGGFASPVSYDMPRCSVFAPLSKAVDERIGEVGFAPELLAECIMIDVSSIHHDLFLCGVFDVINKATGAPIDEYEEAYVKPADHGDVVRRLAQFGGHSDARVRDFAAAMQDMFGMAARVGVDVYFIL